MHTKSLITKLLSITLALSLVLSSGLCCVQAATKAGNQASPYVSATGIAKDENEVGRFNDYPVYKNTYTFPDVKSSVEYYFSDGYFTQSATADNQHLVTTSANMSIAAFGWTSGSNPAYYRISNMLKNMGYEDENIYVNADDWNNPTENTIGIAAAYKHVQNDADDMYIVPVAIRGGNYYSEWIGNAVFGESGNGENYQAAADKTVDFITTNILSGLEDQGVTSDKVKIWITGYSRGGAVANLAAKTLTDTYGADNVYAYCYEAPKCAVDYASTSYSNIRNYAYDADIINYIAPAEFGFGLYGQTETISASTYDSTARNTQQKLIDPNYAADTEGFKEATTNKIDLDNLLSLLTSGGIEIKTVEGSTLTQAEYNAQLLQYVTTGWGIVPSRASYVTRTNGTEEIINSGKSLQDTLKLIFDVINNTDTSCMEEAIKNIDVKNINIFKLIGYVGTLTKMLKNGPTTVDWSDREDLYDFILKLFEDNGGLNNLGDTRKAEFKACWYTACRVAVDVAYYDLQDGYANTIATLVNNAERIADAHYPEAPLAFLRTKDTYYVGCTHSLQKTEKTQATTEAAGNVAYWTCGSCGQYYLDAEGYNEVTSGELVIPQIDASSITLSKTEYIWTGSENKPTVEAIKDTAGNTLVAGTDYDISYKNNVAIGTATATITFKGDYSGSIDKNFSILEGDTLSGKITGYAGINNLTVTLKSISAGASEQSMTATKTGDYYTYKFEHLTDGDYTLTVKATAAADADYVTNSCTVTISGAKVQDMKLHLLGDANMDGLRNAADITVIARYAAKISSIGDSYTKLLLDTRRMGTYGTAADVTQLARYVARMVDAL